MRVLIAEDDAVSRRILQATLERLSYEVVAVEDGAAAWEELRRPDAPRMAVLDWMMPGLDGVEVCRRIRAAECEAYTYVLFLTARGQKADVVAGLEAGADDYLVKPFDPQELRSRLAVGRRVLELESRLSGTIDELRRALGEVRTLQGLLPICMHCKKIRDDGDVWHRMESYIESHSGALFTHSLCESCMSEHYPRVRAGVAGDD